MRLIALLAAAVVFGLLFTGCETTAEDRAFFQEGWVHPEQAAEKRMSTSPW